MLGSLASYIRPVLTAYITKQVVEGISSIFLICSDFVLVSNRVLTSNFHFEVA